MELLRLALLLLALPASAGAEDSAWRVDQLGNGITLPGNLWVAGDVTFTADVPEVGPVTAEIDDVSLLARWEPVARLSLFSELRLEDMLEVVEGEGWNASDGEFAIERLYAEGLLTPALSLRAGKVFTPFGLWNVIHRAPLTWTIEEPAAAEGLFPTHATGLSLLYRTTSHGWSFDATAYGPAQDALRFQSVDPDDPLDETGWLVGTRVAAGRAIGPAFAALGVNAAGFREFDRPGWLTATGLDLEVSIAGHVVTGELTFRVPSDDNRQTVHGSYLQDVIPLAPLTPLLRDVYGVLRFEHFQPPHGSAAIGGVTGLFWRPLPSIVVRAEYLHSTRTLINFEPGFHAALSLLF